MRGRVQEQCGGGETATATRLATSSKPNARRRHAGRGDTHRRPRGQRDVHTFALLGVLGSGGHAGEGEKGTGGKEAHVKLRPAKNLRM